MSDQEIPSTTPNRNGIDAPDDTIVRDQDADDELQRAIIRAGQYIGRQPNAFETMRIESALKAGQPLPDFAQDYSKPGQLLGAPTQNPLDGPEPIAPDQGMEQFADEQQPTDQGTP